MDVVRLTEADAQVASELSDIYTSGPIDEPGLARALGNPDFILLVARIAGAAVGYLHGTLLDRTDGGRMMLVYDLEVAVTHRRSGVGTALMGHARKIGLESGAVETWLVTEGDNDAAVALYKSLGGTRFSAVGYEWSEQ